MIEIGFPVSQLYVNALSSVVPPGVARVQLLRFYVLNFILCPIVGGLLESLRP